MKKNTTTTPTRKRSTNRRSTTSSDGTSGRTKSRRNTANMQQDETGQEEGSSLLYNLFLDLLKDMYWAEKNAVPLMTNMQTQATTEDLQEAIEDHMYVTQKQVTRLEKVFSLLGETPEEKTCVAMEGLIREAEEVIEKTKEGTMTRDAALIICAQKVEHYEIASYGSLVQLALTLGFDNVALLLEKTLWEEEDTDALLTDVAECEVNPMADYEPQEMMAEMEEV
jgi:ferritin-like metal-binding protein YciE